MNVMFLLNFRSSTRKIRGRMMEAAVRQGIPCGITDFTRTGRRPCRSRCRQSDRPGTAHELLPESIVRMMFSENKTT